ncbi:MAG: molybdopterin-dependent oxidoreductase [Desulfatiglans sp.]|jgi:anaerobic selenocysteine-containing dehydrogenase|nr:molybdopterin-dependent oxidoreductase [Desulfatiglans sp.]
MELNRRNFIALILGGAAGINLTPLPWKLMDDVAIWTQNWPWVPVPPVGKFTEVNSICTLCPGGCGIKVRKVDERAVKIEGRTDYPINPGGICPIGMGGLQLLYNESVRFTRPMKRIGPRGAGHFIDISWSEAFETLGSRISKLREEGRPEALAAIDGNPMRSTISLMIERFLKAVGTPNYVRVPCLEDTYQMGISLQQGTEGPVAYDLENSDFILSFGSGLLEGWGAPGRIMNLWGQIKGAEKRGTTSVVQIESRASNTASKADKWMALKPGTDSALALGLAHVILKERLYDSEFVNSHSFGFDDWRSADGKEHIGFKTLILKKYSPNQVSKITGVNADAIISLARDFAKAQAPVAIYGKGKGTLNGSLYEFMAVQSLNALVGRINMPGGVLTTEPIPLSPLPEVNLDSIAQAGLNRPRIDGAGNAQYPFAQSLINNFADSIINAPTSSIDTLLLFSANPDFTFPQRGIFRKALKKIPFIVSFSSYRDETSNMADLILPDCTYLEKMDDVVWPIGLQYPFYGLSKPVVKPLYDVKNSGDVIIKLTKRIGKTTAAAFPWNSYKEVLKDRVKGLYDSGGGFVDFTEDNPPWKSPGKRSDPSRNYSSFGEMWNKIQTGGYWYRPIKKYKGWDNLFKTPTGKFEFFSTRIEVAASRGSSENMGVKVKGDEACMPHYEPIDTKVSRSDHPLLMVPYDMINLSSSWTPNPPFVLKTIFDNQLLRDKSFAAINPKTAVKYKLRQGDKAVIKSPAGKAQVLISLSEGVAPGTVWLPMGFGHTAYDEFFKGKGVNPNDIIFAGKDPLSGHAIWWHTPVQLMKV